MDCVHRRKCSRAVTLLELILASVFVTLLSVVMFLATQSSMAAQKKAWLTQDSQQAVHLALERLREELRGARVSVPSVGAQTPNLSYQKVEFRDNQALLDNRGQPSWQGPFELSLNEGVLTSTRNNIALSRLGDQSLIQFERPEAQRLVVSINVERGSRANGQQSARSAVIHQFFLPNN